MNFHRKLRVEAVRCEQCLVARGEWCGDKSRPSLGILESQREREREREGKVELDFGKKC